MKPEILIILVKAGYCGHCKNFEPIFKTAKNTYKSNDFLKKYNIKFEEYDIANEDIKNIFMINHYNAMDKIKWYPTIFVNIRDTSNKKNTINEYSTIEHTVIGTDNKNEEEAAQNFLTNIVNYLKTRKTDSKTLYTQTGGYNSFNNEIYKKKYFKYKSKYLELKNKV